MSNIIIWFSIGFGFALGALMAVVFMHFVSELYYYIKTEIKLNKIKKGE